MGELFRLNLNITKSSPFLHTLFLKCSIFVLLILTLTIYIPRKTLNFYLALGLQNLFISQKQKQFMKEEVERLEEILKEIDKSMERLKKAKEKLTEIIEEFAHL